jgi:hypothetical protein
MTTRLAPFLLAVLLAACGGTPASPSSPAASTAASAAASPTPEPTGPPPSTDSVFSGSLASAFPKTIGGSAVTVSAPGTGANLTTTIGPSTTALFKALGVQAADVTYVSASDATSKWILFAIRFPSGQDTAIDGAFLATEKAQKNTGDFKVVSFGGWNVRTFTILGALNVAWVNGPTLFWGVGDAAALAKVAAAVPGPTVPLGLDAGSGQTGSVAEITVVLTGGSDPGTYKASLTTGGCSRGASGPGTFSFQYVGSGTFSGLQLLVASASAAGSSTVGFVLTLTVNGHKLAVEPAIANGSGKLTINNWDKQNPTLVLAGKTLAGVGIQLNGSCSRVFDLG